jgi:two-component system response regulator RegA
MDPRVPPLPISFREGPMPMTAVVVDDDPQVLTLAARWLRSAGCEPVMSSCFADARMQIKVFEPSIVIADVRLGGFNGLQLGLLARQIREDVRVLIISGWDEVVLRREAAEFGATFLQKPLSSEQLLTAVGLKRAATGPQAVRTARA